MIDVVEASLADLRAASDEDFVVSAHLAILGRPPYDPEFDRRLREVQGGKTRIEIVGRLALSRDGRRAKRPRAAGVALPALVRFARQQLLQDRDGVAWHVNGVEGLVGENGVVDFVLVLATEGRLLQQHLVDEDTERPPVDGTAITLLQQNLANSVVSDKTRVLSD